MIEIAAPHNRDVDRFLIDYLTGVAEMMARVHSGPDDRRFLSYEGLVLSLGQFWTPRQFPGRRGPMKYCYANTLRLVDAAPEMFRYCEGYAIPSIDGETFIPVQHAWAVTSTGTVYDPTWPEPQNSAYFGIAFDWRVVERFNALGDDYLGILPSEYRLGFPLLRTGALFPGED